MQIESYIFPSLFENSLNIFVKVLDKHSFLVYIK